MSFCGWNRDLFKFRDIILFFYIYNTPINGFPGALTTIRITTIILILLFFYTYIYNKKNRKILPSIFKKDYKKVIVVHFTLLLYAIGLLLFIGRGEGAHITESVINMFLCSLLPVYFFFQLYDSLSDIMRGILMITIVQTIIVWICIFNSEFSDLLDSIFVRTERQQELRGGYAGGLACIAAPGVIKYSLGLLACTYYILSTKKILYFLLYFIFSITGTMIARTGLIISTVGILLIVYNLLKQGSFQKIIKYSIVVSLLCFFFMFFINIGDNAEIFEQRFERLNYLFEVGIEMAFLNSYYDGSTTIIPEISTETIIGLGITSGVSSNGIEINADGGFLKLYGGFGLIVSTLFYSFMFYSFYKMYRRLNDNNIKYVFSFFILLIIIGEFKEWILFDMYMVCVWYVTIAFAYYKQNNMYNQQIDKRYDKCISTNSR